MTELERLDAEIARVEARISFLDDQFFEFQRRADQLREQLAYEADPRLKVELTGQLSRTIEKIDANRDERQQMNAEGDDLGRAYRAELAFQESQKPPPPAPDDGPDGEGETVDDGGDDWLERRRLARERKRKMKP
jgi:hypothetical protein